MATLRRLMSEVLSIEKDIGAAFAEAEANRKREYEAAVKIQAWFRGIQVRRNLKHLAKLVVTVQRFWRGYVDRKLYRVLLKERLFQERLRQYHEHAKVIQRMWRGYYTRKYIFNYYAQKRYLHGLVIKNEAVRKELRSYEELMELKEMEKAREAERKARDDWAFHNHHLLSTSSIPGIYQPSVNRSSARRGAADGEAMLRKVKPHPSSDFLDRLNPMIKLEKQLELDIAALAYHTTNLEAVLPPLDKLPAKPQGPFRSTESVLKRRYKPFRPSLRVQSDYMGLEKARDRMKFEELGMRLHEQPFKPAHNPDLPYEPLLVTTTAFGALDYGTKHFRELQEPPVAFKTVLPPIPIFDNFNDTYSRGTVGL